MLGGARALSVIGAGIIVLSGACRAAEEEVLTLATTTSTEHSGLLTQIHPDFESKTGIIVKVIAKGTGASLQLARDGNADLVLVHARRREDEFVAQGFGVMRRDVMYNDFVIVGPTSDPAEVKRAKTPAEALNRIAAGRHLFVSRGDASGTHFREQEIWRRTGRQLQSKTTVVFLKGKKKTFQLARPPGKWYLSIGQGMSKTIMVATEKQAYTLADRGTYYAFALAEPSKTDLAIVLEGHEDLYNPYGVIAVNPEKHPHVRFAAAKKYIRWITSPQVQKMIGEYRLKGKVLFHPSAVPAKTRAVRSNADHS